jgi:ribulose-bisphosphate carboxylase large chain
MLAGGGVAAHPDGPAAGVRSLRDAWAAAIDGIPLEKAAQLAADAGNPALLHAVGKFAPAAPAGG